MRPRRRCVTSPRRSRCTAHPRATTSAVTRFIPANAFDRAELVSETIRDWAFTNRATLIALSQLKRQASDDYTRSPTIHDLLGGTTLESNASQIWLLDHSRYRKDPQRRGGARTWIGHGKNRLGESRYWVPVYVDHPRLKFTEADTQERDSWPDHPKRKR